MIDEKSEIGTKVSKLLEELLSVSEFFYYDDEYSDHVDRIKKAIDKCNDEKYDKVFKVLEGEDEYER